MVNEKMVEVNGLQYRALRALHAVTQAGRTLKYNKPSGVLWYKGRLGDVAVRVTEDDVKALIAEGLSTSEKGDDGKVRHTLTPFGREFLIAAKRLPDAIEADDVPVMPAVRLWADGSVSFAANPALERWYALFDVASDDDADDKEVNDG